MTREEQIIEAGVEFTLQNCPMCIGGDNFAEAMREFNRNRAFEAGAKWADKTIIDKACEWLFKNTYKCFDGSRVHTIFTSPADMIEDFRKTMEE